MAPQRRQKPDGGREELRRSESRLAGLLELSRMSSKRESELTDFALEKGIELTQSTIGYLAFLNEDESVLTMYSWSKRAMRECAIQDKPVHYPVRTTGLWGEAVRLRRPVITNDYRPGAPGVQGYPEGHVPIHRHMNVPLFDGDRIVLVAGVGNKVEPYEEGDVKQLSLMMDGMWKIIKTNRAEKALRESEARYRFLVQSSNDIILILDGQGAFRFVSPSIERIAGYRPSELEGASCFDLIHPEDVGRVRELFARGLGTPGFTVTTEYRYRHRDGSWLHFEAHAANLLEDPQVDGILVNVRDISARARSDDELRRRQAWYQRQADILMSLMRDGSVLRGEIPEALEKIAEACADVIGSRRVSFWLYSDDYATLRCIELYELDTARHSAGELLQSADFPAYAASHRTGEVIAASDVYADPRTRDIPASYYEERRITSLLDAPVWQQGRVRGTLSFEHSGEPRTWSLEEERLAVTMAALVSLCYEAADRARAEAQQAALRDQLQQAMKMEAVGRLAGGVAHDFNNLLTVIGGHISLLLMDAVEEGPGTESLREVSRATESAASLTRQLLAFSRKQMVEPQVLDLNALVEDLRKMLARLIGEDITLTTALAPELGPVSMDPGQLEQILVNLAVNARDAMPEGGGLSIKTAPVDLDERFCARHPGLRPGPHVALSVTDTGHGMAPEVMAHLFEPFFTTKPKGQGTGLGLATIYGAVRQAGGCVTVDSTAGKGTTFRIYLPRIEGVIAQPRAPRDGPDLLSGHETVLLVEDQDMLRELSLNMLKRMGYQALHASDGAEALALAEQHRGRIDLMITDVVMPGMNGRELSERIAAIHPEAKVLFTSGYTDDVILHLGVLDRSLHYLGKPFSMHALSRKIREVLGDRR